MANNTKILSQKQIFKKGFTQFHEVELVLPNGQKKIHYDVERLPAAIVFPITDEYELCLVSQYRYMLGKTTLEAVAGIIEGNESPLETAQKELREEAGITAKDLNQIAVIDAGGSFFKTASYLFVAKGLTFGEPEPEDIEEGMETVKLSLDEAVGKVFLGEISTASTVIGILMLDKMRREGKL